MGAEQWESFCPASEAASYNTGHDPFSSNLTEPCTLQLVLFLLAPQISATLGSASRGMLDQGLPTVYFVVSRIEHSSVTLKIYRFESPLAEEDPKI